MTNIKDKPGGRPAKKRIEKQQLGQLRADYPVLLVYPAFCRATSRFVSYPCHTFLLLGGILEIATNGRNFLCCQAKQGVSVYRNITLLSK